MEEVTSGPSSSNIPASTYFITLCKVGASTRESRTDRLPELLLIIL